MVRNVIIGGKEVDLSRKKIISQGGEAYIYALSAKEVVKIFRRGDDDFYLGSPAEQKGAEDRLKEHQKKLPVFPVSLPVEVVKPASLVYDKQGLIVGYTMPFIGASNPLLSYSDKSFLRQSGIDNNSVVAILRNLHSAVQKIHAASVVIGDFNNLNVLVDTFNKAYIIDADSFQYGGFKSTVFTDRFVDPLLCVDAGGKLMLAKPHNEMSDWFAFSVMLFQSFLYTNPYGGIYKPKDKTKKIAHELRPLHGISIMNPEVVYPKSATPFKVLPDELLSYFDKMLHKSERKVFPEKLLLNLRWTKCSVCGAEHARAKCPECNQINPNVVKEKVTIRGNVKATRFFTTRGIVLYAKAEKGMLKWLYFEDGKFKREDGRVLTEGKLEPGFRFRLKGSETFFGKGEKLITFGDGSRVVEVKDIDTCNNLPVFDANADNKFWIDQTGYLVRDDIYGDFQIGSAIPGQTMFWTGEKYGFGFYRAGNLATGFIFDARKKGVIDSIKLDLNGQIVDAITYFGSDKFWFFATLSRAGKLTNICYSISRKGEVLSREECNKDTVSHWLAGNLRGKAAVGIFLFASIDDGIIRIEEDGGKMFVSKEFPDTAHFLDSESALHIGKGEIYVVRRNEILSLRLDGIIDNETGLLKWRPVSKNERRITMKAMQLPPNFNEANAYNYAYAVANISALQKVAEEWKNRFALKPVGGDRKKVHLLIIDDQSDFSFPDGSLYVGGRTGKGAMDDQKRLAEFIYRNLGILSQITPTMDSHLPFQIFFPVAHMLDDGSHPEPNTVILADEYRHGKYRANPAMARQIGVDPVWLSKQFTYYCEQLEAKGKYNLYLWAYHCILGSNGHKLAGVIEEARLFHSFARGAANIPEIKGGNPLTEHYSIFKPEVTTCWDGQAIPGAQKNTALIQKLVNSDYVIMAGQASSHCVKESIEDFLAEILAIDPELAKKVYILRDCTSAVVVPGIVDFTDQAEVAMQKFQDAGMNLVDSTTPIEDWPGMKL